jgi:hypothetical protein
MKSLKTNIQIIIGVGYCDKCAKIESESKIKPINILRIQHSTPQAFLLPRFYV